MPLATATKMDQQPRKKRKPRKDSSAIESDLSPLSSFSRLLFKCIAALLNAKRGCERKKGLGVLSEPVGSQGPQGRLAVGAEISDLLQSGDCEVMSESKPPVIRLANAIGSDSVPVFTIRLFATLSLLPAWHECPWRRINNNEKGTRS